MEELTTLIVEPKTEHTATVVFLHGLGDQPESIRSAVETRFLIPAMDHIKWLLLRSPTIPLVANGGKPMASWYNINVFGFRPEVDEDEEGMTRTVKRVHALIDSEISEGVPISRILLAGFSQGGAMSLLAAIGSKWPIGGVASMSGWLPLNEKIKKIATNSIQTMPIFWSHGTEDRNVPSEFKEKSLRILKSLVNDEESVEVHNYKKMHNMCDEEVKDLMEWMNRLIPKSHVYDK